MAAAKIDAAKAEAAAARERSAGCSPPGRRRAAAAAHELGGAAAREAAAADAAAAAEERARRLSVAAISPDLLTAKLLKARRSQGHLAALFTAVVPELAAEELRTSALRLALGRVGVDCEAVAAELRAVEDEVEAPLRARPDEPPTRRRRSIC